MIKKLLKNILSIFVLIAGVLCVLEIIKLNVLPDKYLYIIIGAELIVYILGFILYNRKHVILIILGVLFYVASICLNIAVFYYVNSTNTYLDNNFSLETYKVNYEYYLVTASNNPVSTVQELDKNQEIYYYKYGSSINKALGTLGNYQYTGTDNIFNTLIDLFYKGGYFFIPSSRYKYLMEATSLIKESDFKVIASYIIEDDVPINKSNPSSYNIYINGLDLTGIKRDFNILVTVNTKTRKILLTSIPRDYYIDVPAYGIKDTLMCMGDLDSSVSKEALEELFDTKIDFTFNTSGTSVVKVVDKLGGVEICSDANDTIGLVPGVYSGCRTYSGEETLSIARYRMTLPGRDRSRQDNMRLIMMIILKKVASNVTLTNYTEVLNSFDGLYTTDLNKKTLTTLIKTFVENPNFQILEQSVDGSDSVGMGHLNTEEAWNMTPDMESVKVARKNIKTVLEEK